MEYAPLTTMQLELTVNAAVEDFHTRQGYSDPISCSHAALGKMYHPNLPPEDSLLRVLQSVLVQLSPKVRDAYPNPSEAVHAYIKMLEEYNQRRAWEQSQEGKEDQSLREDIRAVGNACSYFTREGTQPSLLTRRSLEWVLEEVRRNLLPYAKS
jgi:hypothetical protein